MEVPSELSSRQPVSASPHQPTSKRIEFSLFYFGSDAREHGQDKYRMLLEGAQFADAKGFAAVWTPERHFNAVGGLYPNPSLTAVAIAMKTRRIQIRAGSVVLPLHHPARVAEEWSVVDNLSNGRAAISFASGWHAHDFAIAPENFADRKDITFSNIETVRRLWRGESINATSGSGEPIAIKIFPQPIQPELPMWLTSSGHADTFKMAGALGVNLLTHMFGQGIHQLAEKIEIYRAAWRAQGHPGDGYVTVMMHTFVWNDLAAAREKVRGPLRDYLRTYRDLSKSAGTVNGSSSRPTTLRTPTEADVERLLDEAADRYIEGSGLFGTPEHCMKMVKTVSDIGADEIACLIDFGVDTDSVLASLEHLNELRVRCQPTRNGEMAKCQANDRPALTPVEIIEQPARNGTTAKVTPRSMSQTNARLRAILGSLPELKSSPVDDSKTFVEQGFDSLLLTQISLAIEKDVGVKVPFRRLFEDLGLVDKLASYLDAQLPTNGRVQVEPPLAHVGAAATNLDDELRMMSGVEQQLTQTLGIKDITSIPGLEREFNDLCSAYICDYLQSCQITIEAGRRYAIADLHSTLKLRPVYKRFLQYMLTVLAEDGIIRLDTREIEWLRNPSELPNSATLHDRLLKQFPEFQGLLEMLRHCARHYREALAGDILGVTVLLPGGRHDFVKQHLKHYTDYYKCTRIYEGVARELVLSLSQKSPLRILEVGGGSGELTWQLAPDLAGRGCEYHFTDLGRIFVQSARQEAARRKLDFMKFGVLDISKPPASQGYPANSFNIVLALNVVHATARVGESLAQLKQLLAPGGLICLVELTRYHRWDTMIIGLADGWWLFEDAVRKDSPLLQLAEWEQEFRNQQFASVYAFPSDPQQRHQTDSGLILAQC